MTEAEAAPSTPVTKSPRLVVDARGSWCPGPLMELVRVIKEEPVGTEFELLSSDEGSRKDVPLWLDKAGHQLVELRPDSGFDRFIIRKLHE
ncbi:MAG TPA: sulfurtransferase TusA family protein [Thermoplasmata archaeon]|nr:sulfurtransferase TusA family protein [Thermoplasmata archaeon]